MTRRQPVEQQPIFVPAVAHLLTVLSLTPRVSAKMRASSRMSPCVMAPPLPPGHYREIIDPVPRPQHVRNGPAALSDRPK